MDAAGRGGNKEEGNRVKIKYHRRFVIYGVFERQTVIQDHTPHVPESALIPVQGDIDKVHPDDHICGDNDHPCEYEFDSGALKYYSVHRILIH